jgi:DnaK suppressor protein
MHTPFAPATLNELHRRLERRHHSARQMAAHCRHEADLALQDPDVSDLLDRDDPASGTDADRGNSLALAALAEHNAEAAHTALRRLDLGNYGYCDDCGARIPLARLRALPETTLCVDCKQTNHQLALVG